MRPITNNADKLATIYIISKGRPDCKTARTLTNLNYPGAWFIVCGNNDETLQEYIDKWGKDKILVFDWYEQIKHTDVMDNFGFDTMPSGAAPVRNAVFEFSRQRGELRHWQMDDDFTNVHFVDVGKKHTSRVTSGELLYWWLVRIAEFADNIKAANIGIALKRELFPDQPMETIPKVYGVHNMSNDPSITPEWKGRLNDDTLHAISVKRLGQGWEIQTRFLGVDTPPSQTGSGGLTEFYQAYGTVRKTAYLILAAPNAAKLVIRYKRYHHKMRWDLITSKLISEKWQRK